MASKVPKFGAWGEGDENYTVFFERARDSNHTGKKINPNDPQENPDMFRPIKGSAQTQNQTQTNTDKKRQAKVPPFGEWENVDSTCYTQNFEHLREGKLGGPVVVAAENEPQLNRDMPHYPGPSVHAKAQVRPQAQAGQPRTQNRADKKIQPTVPHFGAWDNGDSHGYTQTFDKVRENRHGDPYSNGPQPNRDVGPTPLEGRGKVPVFGDWDGGEAVQYTEYFKNPNKIKNLRPGQNSADPKLNRDVSQGSQGDSVASRDGPGRPSAGAQAAPVYPKANLRPRPPANGGNPPAPIPNFGGWNTEPSQADDYTGAFTRAIVERQTPVSHYVPTPRQQRYHSSQQNKEPSCCTIL
ncbi:hypothetical protein KSS87_018224 [Heliosperma pusillum]|nr:hypothetical protein KSS87_018224 [Heliosperma pusillum]